MGLFMKSMFSALLACLLVIPEASLAQEKAVSAERLTPSGSGSQGNWALVVGINRFKDSSVSPLSYAVADAVSFHTAITAKGGLVPPDQAYLIVTDGQRQPTRNEILKSISYIVENTPEDGLIVVYFSSHGFIDKKERSYVMTEDGDLSILEDTAVPVARVQELLSEAGAGKRLLFIDACRNLATRGTKGSSDLSQASLRLAEELRGAQGIATLVSCDSGQVSFEDDSVGHGVFTHFLLEGLSGKASRDENGFVTMSSLSDYVSESVENWCKTNQKSPIQEPWLIAQTRKSIPLAYFPGSQGGAPPEERVPAVVPTVAAPDTGEAQSAQPFEARSFTLPGGESIEMIYLPGEGSLRGFWIGRDEVTQDQWRSVAQTSAGLNPSPSKADGDPNHVQNILMADCERFCSEIGKGYHLPTEAEWQYACRVNAEKGLLANMDGNLGEWCRSDRSKPVYCGKGSGADCADCQAVSGKTPPSGFIGFRIARQP